MRFDAKQMGLSVLALILTAPALPAQSPTKVAIINIQSAILATKDGEKARNALTAKFEPRAKDLESRGGELQKKRETLNKGANMMSAEAREKLTREIDDFQKKLQWDSEDMQQEVQQEQGKLVNDIGQRMIQVLDEYSKAQGFTIVLDVSTQQSPVLWAANGIDVTQQIIELYDKKYAAGAPGAAPAAPAAKPAAPPAAAPKKPAGAK
ncbi:OmpH family outer membrane protein [Paludibaculum fermentans]|uniref:OmpH family outer membrane protein n=1 Tax=Paludibaculum fermentans TaxID=1473598 RepID=UPI003EBEF164